MKLVVLVVDSLRAADVLGGDGAARTPTLDALGAGGTRFDDCVASGAWTIPSILSMLAGVWPHRLGVARWRHEWPAGVPTLLSAAAAAGFEVRVAVPHPAWGLLPLAERGAPASSQDVAAVEAALRSRSGHDVVVVVHHWWTHLPYLCRELGEKAWFALCEFQLESLRRHPSLGGQLAAAHREAVEHFAERLLPRYADAAAAGGGDVLVALVGDHGESWGEALPAGRRVETIYDLHGRWITDATVRVPWLAWGRGAAGAPRAGARVAATVRGVDLGPTMAALAGIPWPAAQGGGDGETPGPSLDGRDLAPFVVAGAEPPPAEVLAVTSHNAWAPRVFPAAAPELWRSFGARVGGRWHQWDGVGRVGWVVGEDGRPAVVDPAHEPAAAVFRALEARRIGESRAARARDDHELPPAPEIAGRLRMLGYLE